MYLKKVHIINMGPISLDQSPVGLSHSFAYAFTSVKLLLKVKIPHKTLNYLNLFRRYNLVNLSVVENIINKTILSNTFPT